MVQPRIFFDFTIGAEPARRVIFELFKDAVPKTVENFRALCTGEKGLSAISQRPLYYKNSIIHRSINDFMIQGGDFTKRNGTGGESIYGGTFLDEDLSRPLDAEGLLCMANRGPDTNGSQFFITLRECPHLNGKHVVFGKVIKGQKVVEKVAQVPVDEKDRPLVPIVIANCGELELRRKVRRSVEADTQPSYRSRKRSRSSEAEDRRHKKSKHKNKNKDETGQPLKSMPHGETEEEYDARLAREEQQRIEAAKRNELERCKQFHSNDASSGVRFKGRGRMKFRDPELYHR